MGGENVHGVAMKPKVLEEKIYFGHVSLALGDWKAVRDYVDELEDKVRSLEEAKEVTVERPKLEALRAHYERIGVNKGDSELVIGAIEEAGR